MPNCIWLRVCGPLLALGLLGVSSWELGAAVCGGVKLDT